MKILKEGKWNLPWSGTYACPTCEAELLVEEKDVKAPDYATGFECACAVCGKRIPLPDKDLPLRIKEALNAKRKYSSSWD